ncbi:MAG TPA: cytochrome-c peroxidase [Polyangia bacterium]|nr:cytochrome-c peroxidase [Polyangia bacterium]
MLALGLGVTSGACFAIDPGQGGTTISPPTQPPTLPPTGGGDGGVSASFNPPIFDSTTSAADPPPPVSGGTLAILPDGVTAVAADPDRDTISVVDLSVASYRLTATVALQPHDEPGRLVADAAGHVHVILRRGGALVTIDPVAGTILARRAACPIPRGVAYDPATDLVHVACMGGELVSFPAAGGDATRTLQLPRDLRDVVVDGDTLLVSQFRSAQVLVVDANGDVTETIGPPSYSDPSARNGDTFTASTAWQMRAQPGGGAVLLHQRGTTGVVVVGGKGSGTSIPQDGGVIGGPNGYGSSDPCGGLVHPALTPIAPGMTPPAAPPIPGMVLPVDFAISSDGASVAIVAAGNAHNLNVQSLFVSDYSDLTDHGHPSCCPDGVHGPTPVASMGNPLFCPPPPKPPTPCQQPMGEVEAVQFDGSNRVVVQTREPATLQIPSAGVTISLSALSRADIGHEIFHANTGNGIACASCHAEGQEDGRTWTFDTEGARRTMNVAGGISGRAPYHWDGELTTFGDLVTTVYNGRMGGPTLSSTEVASTQSWMNAIPALPGVVSDPDAVTRGQAVFSDPGHGCVVCHNGAQLTNDASNVNVGTGGSFKVPSLVGLAYTAPYLHDGCAATLADRFGACGGGDQHGVTSTLTPAQLSDLIAYLDSL